MSERPFNHTAFNAYLAERRLMGTRCRACGARHLPPRPLCPACYGDDLEWVELPARGTLRAFTIVAIAPTAMLAAGYSRENPYCAGVVELDGGGCISAQILGVDVRVPAAIRVGMPVTLEFVMRGTGAEERTALAFRAAP